MTQHVVQIGGEPVAPTLPAPGSASAWLLAARPRTLVAGWAPVLVGSTIGAWGAMAANHNASVIRALAALAVALLIQISTNFVNDAADHARGADTAERLGPPRAVALGLLPGSRVMRAAVACSVVAGVIGVWLAAVSSLWLLIPGGLAILAGIAYTAGPRPLAYAGLGEVFVFLFFGLFATVGSAVVQWPTIFPELLFMALFAGASLGAFSVAIISINNIRDAPLDTTVGKATLAVRLGDERSRAILANLIVAAFALWALAVSPLLRGLFPLSLVYLLPLLTLPMGSRIWRAAKEGRQGRAWNEVLVATARLMSVFAGLAAVGLLLPWALAVVQT